MESCILRATEERFSGQIKRKAAVYDGVGVAVEPLLWTPYLSGESKLVLNDIGDEYVATKALHFQGRP